MPFISIKMAAPEPSEEQKQQIIEEITNLMVKILNKDPNRVMVAIQTMKDDSIGIGGKSIKQIKKEK